MLATTSTNIPVSISVFLLLAYFRGREILWLILILALCRILFHLFKSFYSMSCLFKLLLSAIYLTSCVKYNNNNNKSGKKIFTPLHYFQVCPETSCEGVSALVSFTCHLLFKPPQLGFDFYQSMESTVFCSIFFIFQFFFNAFTFYTHNFKKWDHTLFSIL